MALSITQHAQVADWNANSSATRSITGVNWLAGDTIVVCGGTDGDRTLTVPTNANLTFRQVAICIGTASESYVYLWVAKAASAQSTQQIDTTISVSTNRGGIAVWVITGGATALINHTMTQHEAARTIVTQAGSIVVCIIVDFAGAVAGKTATTGSGTATERLDYQAPSFAYSLWIGDWVGTSYGSFSFGITSYTGWTVGQIVVEVKDSSPRYARGKNFRKAVA